MARKAASVSMWAVGLLHSSQVAPVTGHGWLSEPPARNADSGSKNGYCPHCGNGAGVCGDGGQWPGDSNYVNFYDGPQRSFAPGDIVDLTIKITAHHKGHFEFNVCDEHVDGSLQDAQACLNKLQLKRVPPEESYGDCVPNDSRGDCQPYLESQAERWYLPPGTGTYSMRFRLPGDVQCDSCTLQWRWWTANSCIPKANYGCWFDHMAEQGWDKAAWCGAFCGECGAGSTDSPGCGEEFRNCADISIKGAVAPSTTPSAPSSTQSVTTPVTQPSSSSTTLVATTTAQPAPSPIPSTTPAPTSNPSPALVEGECRANPDLNRGVSDGDCEKCETGYQWWPCNEAELCICGAPSTATTTTTNAPPTTTTDSTTASCNGCQGENACLWSDGVCYPHVAKDACTTTAGTVWCGN